MIVNHRVGLLFSFYISFCENFEIFGRNAVTSIKILILSELLLLIRITSLSLQSRRNVNGFNGVPILMTMSQNFLSSLLGVAILTFF